MRGAVKTLVRDLAEGRFLVLKGSDEAGSRNELLATQGKFPAPDALYEHRFPSTFPRREAQQCLDRSGRDTS
jgi:hypothetical protein